MKSNMIPLTTSEAAEIAQRAFVEKLVEKPGIWTLLQERIRPLEKQPKTNIRPHLLKLSV